MEDAASGTEKHLTRTDAVLPDESIDTDPIFLSSRISNGMYVAAFCLIALVFCAILTLV